MARGRDTAPRSAVDLTGSGSHEIRREPGAGNLYIGPVAQPRDVPQARVEPDEVLRWEALDALPRVPSGSPWPRWITYEGNDVGFFEWARTRPIEGFTWKPSRALTVDARSARIDELTIILADQPLHIALPAKLRLYVEGRTDLLEPKPGGAVEDLKLGFGGSVESDNLSFYEALSHVRSLWVERGRYPTRCSAVARYPKLRRLAIRGPIREAAALAALGDLEVLEFRETWDLGELPPVETWSALEEVFVAELSSKDGKRIKAEAKRAGVEARVRGQRSEAWIAENADLPFLWWPARLGNAARRAYNAAVRALQDATTDDERRAAVADLVTKLNRLDAKHGLETAHREDVADAVARLVEGAPPEVVDQAMACLDELREF